MHDDDGVILVSGEKWHEGVIGILASRLARHFTKPAFVFSKNDGVAKGSARSVGKIDILELISTQKDLLLGFGGHKGASGMSVEVRNLEALKANLNALVKEIPSEDFENKSEILLFFGFFSLKFEANFLSFFSLKFKAIFLSFFVPNFFPLKFKAALQNA